jgi:1-acyl-sn-glycerol-3-phosphate acyltransferase
VLFLRSLVFNALFYLNIVILMVLALPAFLLPSRVMVEMAKQWGRNSLWLLRVVCGVKVEYRGRDKIPAGALLVAAKHQSAWDTFALLHLFEDPTFVIKRELTWIPLFGWCSWKAGMIPVDRGAGKTALAAMAARTRAAMARARQIVIFPEGTRRAPGAEPNYKVGIAFLYGEAHAPCLPIALNSGLFWPRRKLMRYPGTVVVDILDPIQPGLDRGAFLKKLAQDIETSTARLVDEGRRELAAQGIRVEP